jgi:hypothetical protein
MSRDMLMKSICTALSLVALAALAAGVAAQDGTGRHNSPGNYIQRVWSSAAPMPAPAQEIYPTLVGKQIVVAGGFGAKGVTDRTMIYESDRKAWRTGSPLPVPRHHIHLFTRGDTVLAVGGYEVRGKAIWIMRASVWVLDGAMQNWAPGPALPDPRAECAGGNIEGTLILAAGRTLKDKRTGQREDHVEASDTLLLHRGETKWTRGKPIPTPRMSGASAVLNGKLHVLGGRVYTGTGISYRNLDAHEAYDPKANSWSKRAPLPRPAAGIAATVMEGKLYVFGGESDKKPYGVYDFAWVYDPNTDKWSKVASMPVTRHGHGAVTLPDGIHVIGGSEKVGGTGTTARHDVFRIESNGAE